MFRLDADKPAHFCDGVSRRDFLHAGSLGFLGLTMPHFFRLKAMGAVEPSKDVNCIHLMLVGGPSQLDTWDMKPDAPASIRGPFKPIKTNVSGIEISEIFPRMATHADKFALLRSAYHTAAAAHDTGCQMMQTGRLFQGGLESPNYGSVLRFEKGAKGDMPPKFCSPTPSASSAETCLMAIRQPLTRARSSGCRQWIRLDLRARIGYPQDRLRMGHARA